MAVLRTWFMPIILGVLVGTMVARFAPPAVFKVVFIIIALITASRLVFSERLSCLASDLPRGIPMIGYGVTIGVSSSLMGIGGGLVGNMILTLYGRAIHQAIATSSGVGVLVSLPGALGYVLAGWGKGDLPPFSLGFVSIIGLLLLMPASLLTAKLGATLAHQLSKKQLELGLAAYLLLVSVRFAATLVG